MSASNDEFQDFHKQNVIPIFRSFHAKKYHQKVGEAAVCRVLSGSDLNRRLSRISASKDCSNYEFTIEGYFVKLQPKLASKSTMPFEICIRDAHLKTKSSISGSAWEAIIHTFSQSVVLIFASHSDLRDFHSSYELCRFEWINLNRWYTKSVLLHNPLHLAVVSKAQRQSISAPRKVEGWIYAKLFPAKFNEWSKLYAVLAYHMERINDEKWNVGHCDFKLYTNSSCQSSPVAVVENVDLVSFQFPDPNLKEKRCTVFRIIGQFVVRKSGKSEINPTNDALFMTSSQSEMINWIVNLMHVSKNSRTIEKDGSWIPIQDTDNYLTPHPENLYLHPLSQISLTDETSAFDQLMAKLISSRNSIDADNECNDNFDECDDQSDSSDSESQTLQDFVVIPAKSKHQKTRTAYSSTDSEELFSNSSSSMPANLGDEDLDQETSYPFIDLNSISSNDDLDHAAQLLQFELGFGQDAALGNSSWDKINDEMGEFDILKEEPVSSHSKILEADVIANEDANFDNLDNSQFPKFEINNVDSVSESLSASLELKLQIDAEKQIPSVANLDNLHHPKFEINNDSMAESVSASLEVKLQIDVEKQTPSVANLDNLHLPELEIDTVDSMAESVPTIIEISESLKVKAQIEENHYVANLDNVHLPKFEINNVDSISESVSASLELKLQIDAEKQIPSVDNLNNSHLPKFEINNDSISESVSESLEVKSQIDVEKQISSVDNLENPATSDAPLDISLHSEPVDPKVTEPSLGIDLHLLCEPRALGKQSDGDSVSNCIQEKSDNGEYESIDQAPPSPEELNDQRHPSRKPDSISLPSEDSSETSSSTNEGLNDDLQITTVPSEDIKVVEKDPFNAYTERFNSSSSSSPSSSSSSSSCLNFQDEKEFYRYAGNSGPVWKRRPRKDDSSSCESEKENEIESASEDDDVPLQVNQSQAIIQPAAASTNQSYLQYQQQQQQFYYYYYLQQQQQQQQLLMQQMMMQQMINPSPSMILQPQPSSSHNQQGNPHHSHQKRRNLHKRK